MDEHERLIADFEKLDIYSLRIIPEGADKPLAYPTDQDAIITKDDVLRALRTWDKVMPEYKGLLKAELRNATRP
jgi:hypothetical protein